MVESIIKIGFKPCFKWLLLKIVVNGVPRYIWLEEVLNLVLNGYSLKSHVAGFAPAVQLCFKPCFKWLLLKILTISLGL